MLGLGNLLAPIAPLVVEVHVVWAKAHFIENTQRLSGSPHDPGMLT